ncbi:hypothetical protein D3C86_2197400 [compost metagenome]
MALTLLALTTGLLSWFYNYGWFTGSLLGGLLYYVCAGLTKRSPVAAKATA